jgi:hypothetical protein
MPMPKLIGPPGPALVEMMFLAPVVVPPTVLLLPTM